MASGIFLEYLKHFEDRFFMVTPIHLMDHSTGIRVISWWEMGYMSIKGVTFLRKSCIWRSGWCILSKIWVILMVVFLGVKLIGNAWYFPVNTHLLRDSRTREERKTIFGKSRMSLFSFNLLTNNVFILVMITCRFNKWWGGVFLFK